MKRRWQQQQRGSTLVTIFVDPHDKSQRKAQVLDSLFLIPPDVAFLESLQAPLQIERRTVSKKTGPPHLHLPLRQADHTSLTTMTADFRTRLASVFLPGHACGRR